ELARDHQVDLEESGRVTIAGADVTSAIRQSRIDRMVPVVARHTEVREVMRERQRELAELGDAVIEGRDIGTVVCPDADVKVYLVADRSVREGRRQAERPDIGADALATDLRAFGTACPRTIHFLAKSEIHRHFGLGQLIRAFGTRSVRRGESDREAVRAMREIVRDGHALGLFVEGTRQKNGMPGEAMPGA